jgi:transposase-like protein
MESNAGKQNHICADCQRQFFEQHEPKGYSNLVKEECLKMYCNGMGFRAIERVKGVHHTTIICWVKQIGEQATPMRQRWLKFQR